MLKEKHPSLKATIQSPVPNLAEVRITHRFPTKDILLLIAISLFYIFMLFILPTDTDEEPKN
jgi:hypothetical protein